jgi:uncharacterized protein (TIGR02284 family)
VAKDIGDRVADLLERLIRLDYDAIDAYDQAIQRISDTPSKQNLTLFRADHDRHVRDLSPHLIKLGKQPPSKGDFKRFLTQGKVVLASLVGDLTILKAMWSNEDTTNKEYEEAVRSDMVLDASLKNAFELCLADERRHRAWIIQRYRELETEQQRKAA